tara:strand:+ start:49 stop:435 length:387 start_codon:yes stop_codon:yes gene_type:complete
MAKRLPKPYTTELNNGRFPNELSILIMSDYTGLITSTNSNERAEATIKKNNKKYSFGCPLDSFSFRPNAPMRGLVSEVRQIEIIARNRLHDEIGSPYNKAYFNHLCGVYGKPFGPYMKKDPLHKYLNK